MSTYREMLPYVRECMGKEYSITLEEAVNGTTEQRKEYLEGACVRLLRSCYEYTGDCPSLHWDTEYERLIVDTYKAFRAHDFKEVIEAGEEPYLLGLDLPKEIYDAVDEFWFYFIYIFGIKKLLKKEDIGL